MKSTDAVQLLHDRMTAVILKQTPIELSKNGRRFLSLQCGVLCWLLGHTRNPSFELNMAHLARRLRSEGILPTHREAIPPQALASVREAGERFMMISPNAPESLDRTAIQCLTCGQVSWIESDVKQLYCARCDVFHVEALERDLAELEKAAETRSEDTR